MRIAELFNDYIFGQMKVLTAGSYPEVSKILQKIIGVKAWQSIVQNTPDRRQLIEAAALKKGLREEELIKQIAEKLDVPVFFRPKPTDIDALPESIIFPDLRSAGVLPITVDGIVSGIVCVDPAALNFMPQLYAGSNIYLSSWQAILAALDESEQLYRQKRESLIQKVREQELQIYKKIIANLAEQALDAESKKISLLSDADSLLYSFKDKTEREWSGNIDPKIALKLAKYLEDSIAEDVNIIEVQSSENKKIIIQLQVEHGRIVLILSEKIISLENENQVEIFSHDNTKIMQFPRLIKREIHNFKPSFQTGSEANVLLVDDNPTFALVLQKFLHKQNINVEICNSVEAALSYLKSKSEILPDLIISDLHMPGVHGHEFIRIIKQEMNLNNIPIIALTSDESPETELSLLAVGADAFVTKTKDPRILCVHVKRLIDSRRAA